MGSRIRFVELGVELDFRLKTSQVYLLDKHRFHSKEAIQPLLNRQLRRLARAIVSGKAPTLPVVVEGNKDRKFTFRPETLLVEPLIQQQRIARRLATDAESAAYLVAWSAALPLQMPLLDAAAVHRFLLDHYGRGSTVPIRESLLKLYDYCDVGDAKLALWELKEAGKLTLGLPRQEHLAGGVIRLPDGHGKVYYYLHL